MSIALEIIRIAEQTARNNQAGHISSIVVEVGLLAGVMISSLEFCLENSLGGTLAQGAEINIAEIPAAGQCPACKKTFPMRSIIEACPDCNKSFLNLQSGDILRVKEIEID